MASNLIATSYHSISREQIALQHCSRYSISRGYLRTICCLLWSLCLVRMRKACQPTASVTSKSAGILSTNSGVSVTSVDVAMFTFGLTVFTVTLGWTISSAYSSSLGSMILDAKKSLASGKRLLSAGLKRLSMVLGTYDGECDEQGSQSVKPRMKEALQDIWMAEIRDDAYHAFLTFQKRFEAKYPKATDCLVKDKPEMLAFYDYQAEHWVHIRTTNPIESMFATICLRTDKTKNCGNK